MVGDNSRRVYSARRCVTKCLQGVERPPVLWVFRVFDLSRTYSFGSVLGQKF